MDMELGIVTANTGKPNKNNGLTDIIKVVNERTDMSYRIINPQNIFVREGNFYYHKDKKEDFFPVSERGNLLKRNFLDKNKRTDVNFFEEFESLDHILVRSFTSKNSKSIHTITKKALTMLNKEITNNISSIEYCNDKLTSIIDFSTTDAEIVIDQEESLKISSIVPPYRVFTQNDTSVKEKEAAFNYVRKRLQGRHNQVLKAINGRGGKGMMPIHIGSPYKALIENYEHSNFIAQDLIQDCVPLRVQIIGHGHTPSDIKGAYYRIPEEGDFRAQKYKELKHYELNEIQTKVSLWIHRRAGTYMSAIDYLLDLENGKLHYLEINGENPGWQNLKQVFKEDEIISKYGLAPNLIDFIFERHKERDKPKVPTEKT